MKIRNGFVSNSSSSSFILYFKEKPKNEEELKHLIFDENNIKNSIVGGEEYNGLVFPIDMITNTVFNDIDYESNITVDNFLEKFKDDLYPSEYNIYEIKTLFENLDIKYNFDEIEIELEKIGREKHDERYELIRNINNYTEEEYDNRFNKFYEKYDSKIEKIADEIYGVFLPIFKEKCKDNIFYEVEYSDNDGEYFSFIEHSGVLDRITLMKINKH